MLLKPAPVSTRQFTYDRQSRTFTAEASDLGHNPFGRAYDDSCDVGLTLISHRTGIEIVFVLDEEDRDAEGDIRFWVFKPAINRLAHQHLASLRVVVFND